MTDLNVPFCDQNPNLPRLVQAFFLGEGLPAFVVTVYSSAKSIDSDVQLTTSESQAASISRQSDEYEQQKTEIHKVTVSAIKLLRWSLLDFCHCKFVILPLALDIETLSLASLEEELKLRQRRCRQYYDGDLCLKAETYKTLSSAAIALQGTSSLSYFLGTTLPWVRPSLLLTVSVLIYTSLHSYRVTVGLLFMYLSLAYVL